MQVRTYVCYSEYGRKAKLQPIFFRQRFTWSFFIGFGFWFCFLVFSLGVITKLGLQSCIRYVSMSYFPTIVAGYVMVVHVSMPNNLHAMFAILRLQHLMDRSMTQVTFTLRLCTSQSLYCTKAKLFIEKGVDM